MKKPKITFARARNNDVDLLDKLYCKLAVDEGKFLIPKVTRRETVQGLKKYEKERKADFIRELSDAKNNFWYFAKIGEQVVGFIHARISAKKRKTARVEKIYVRGELRGRGIATQLFKFIFKKLKSKGIKTIEHGILIKNILSREVHKFVGFREVGITMRKRL